MANVMSVFNTEKEQKIGYMVKEIINYNRAMNVTLCLCICI